MGHDRDVSTGDLVAARPAGSDPSPPPSEPRIGTDPDAPETDDREPPVAEDAGTPEDTESDPGGPLVSDADADSYYSRWDAIQAGFVDEPRDAVAQADGLVAEVMRHLAEGFADERSRLEGQWERGEQVDTEDLRVALQRYRAFFNRLLSA